MLIITVFLFLGVLTTYNLSLKAAYLKGTFRERFGEHTFRQLDNVKELQLKAANMIGISVEQGEREGVWISNRVKDLVKVDQAGGIVILDLKNTDPKNYQHINTGDVVMIVNKLSKISTYNYLVKGKMPENYGGEMNIKDLSGDSFNLVIAEQGTVYIEGSRFRSFKTVVGGNKYWSRLTVSGDNRLDTAYFDIRKSSLELQNPAILVPHYKFGDSSRVELWGQSAQKFAR